MSNIEEGYSGRNPNAAALRLPGPEDLALSVERPLLAALQNPTCLYRSLSLPRLLGVGVLGTNTCSHLSLMTRDRRQSFHDFRPQHNGDEELEQPQCVHRVPAAYTSSNVARRRYEDFTTIGEQASRNYVNVQLIVNV